MTASGTIAFVDQNKAATEARRRKATVEAPIQVELLRLWRTSGDRTDRGRWADPTGWWRDSGVLGRLGSALADLFPDAHPTVVLGTQSRGTMIAALVATHLGVGVVEVRKNDGPAADSEAWRQRTTPPDYRDRHLRLGFPKGLLLSGERVLFVDDWVDTGGQAIGVRGLVQDAGAEWLGAAVIVDDLADARLRRDLGLRSLLRGRDVWK